MGEVSLYSVFSEQLHKSLSSLHGSGPHGTANDLITAPPQDAHTGTTPLDRRADAMLLAARIVAHSHRLATRHGALASTGILTLEPGSVNTIPGYVKFSLDVRAAQDSTIDAFEADLACDVTALARYEEVEPRGLLASSTPSSAACEITWRRDSVSPAIRFHPDCIAAVRAAAVSVTGSESLVREMTSGAGHDSVYASRRCPTSMIFVPCRDGVSHNPSEYTTPEDCAIGAEVLCQAIVRYDRLRAKAA